MSKKCAREDCGKTVYPIEELKCLDKIWHKQCFKCTVCGMTLSMKNYKGYDKMPYCNPHYPKTVASVVADTPEMRRIAENTKNQSNIKYHAEYEKMRGTKIEIADDPEMERLKKNTQVQSNVSYHGVLDQKARQEESRPKEDESPNPTPNGAAAGGAANLPRGMDEELAENDVELENVDCWQIPVTVYPFR
uniref:LIM zinc-binding domain-containing protein n=1 Tax=Caenorhabditis japonica TaxID=281687 RepID=A0A8R1DHA6_CAEJA